ncbi:polyphosphate kinase 1 [Deinococcus sp. UYEF24]
MKHKKSIPGETFSASALPESTSLNRELSWLAFNERVLAEAQDPRNPLLERLKYAAICGSNLDEFFMVRVAGVHRQIAAGVVTKSPDGLLPRETLSLVRERTHVMLREIEKTARKSLADLNAAGVRIVKVSELGKKARAALKEHYLTQIQPVLTPLIVDPSHPFPYISNLSLNLAVLLRDGQEAEPEFARVKIPVGVLPRFVVIGEVYLLLEDVIAEHLQELFRGREVMVAYEFRVTRNTDYEFDEDEAEDLLATIEDGLRRRRFGAVVRLEVTREMPAVLLGFLAEKLKLDDLDVFQLEGPLGTADLMGFPSGDVARQLPELSYPTFTPHVPDLDGDEDDGVFAELQRGDQLLHHPYDSFAGVLAFLEAAAADPGVLAIKQTLYRTGDDRRLLGALRTAAENGKQVVALIELKARFDEQRNISWARQLERAGAHVVYGVSGLKVHGKVALVVRREEGRLRSYVHIGTGNYNAKTARLYTDLSLLSANEALGADVAQLFNHLTGYAEAEYSNLLVAPDTARKGLLDWLEQMSERARAIRAAQAEHPDSDQPQERAWARIKINQLTDPAMIDGIYKASQAGVEVDLMIRGVCCLRPGVPGLSENVRVHSLLGRYLEHARVYAFGYGTEGEEQQAQVYIGSADWMSRNLDRRVEVLAPVSDPVHRQGVLDLVAAEWADTRGSWELGPDGVYRKLPGDLSAQETFMRARGSVAG